MRLKEAGDKDDRAVMTMMAAESAAKMAPTVAPVALTATRSINFVRNHITVVEILKDFYRQKEIRKFSI